MWRGAVRSFGVGVWPTSWKVRDAPQPWVSILAAGHTSLSLRLRGPEAAGDGDGVGWGA